VRIAGSNPVVRSNKVLVSPGLAGSPWPVGRRPTLASARIELWLVDSDGRVDAVAS